LRPFNFTDYERSESEKKLRGEYLTLPREYTKAPFKRLILINNESY